MQLFRLLSLLASSALVFAAVSTAHADPIITAGSQTTVADGGIAPGSAANYTFFGGSQPTNLTNFTVDTGDDFIFAGFPQSVDNLGYRPLTAPDGTGPFITGIALDNSCVCAQTTRLATFSTLTDGSFTVYILDGATEGFGTGNSSVGLGVNGGTAITTLSQVYSGISEFTAFTVTGATTSDVFDVYATGTDANTPTYIGDTQPSIGGLTFGPASVPTPTPEPSSILLFGTGILGIAGACRRRFLKA